MITVNLGTSPPRCINKKKTHFSSLAFVKVFHALIWCWLTLLFHLRLNRARSIWGCTYFTQPVKGIVHLIVFSARKNTLIVNMTIVDIEWCQLIGNWLVKSLLRQKIGTTISKRFMLVTLCCPCVCLCSSAKNYAVVPSVLI